MRRFDTDRRGIALIFVVGLLGLMAMFALSFSSIMSLERSTAQARVESYRADIVAHAGINFAIEQLRAHARRRAFDDSRPEPMDTDPTKRGDRWLFRGVGYPNYTGTSSDTATPRGVGHGIPLENATHVSFAHHYKVATDTAAPGSVFEQKNWDELYTFKDSANAAFPGFRASGFLGATYRDFGDQFMLKVIDCASQINLNGPVLSTERMLNTLVKSDVLKAYYTAQRTRLDESFTEHGRSLPASVMSWPSSLDAQLSNFVAWWKTFREGDAASSPVVPARLFVNKSQLLQFFSEPELAVVGDFFSIHGWIDTNVFEGSKRGTASKFSSAAMGSEDRGYRPNYVAISPKLEAPAVYGRQPVNLNTAPLPVLIAVISGVGADRFMEANDGGNFGLSGKIITSVGKPTQPRRIRKASAGSINLTRAKKIAARALLWREKVGPFTCWRDVALFCADTSANGGGVSGALDTDTLRSLFMAAMSPHNIFLDFNPDQTLKSWDHDLWRMDVQKWDVTEATTELCFSSMGFFQIEAVGRIVQGSGIIAAESREAIVARVFDVKRISTQSQLDEFTENSDNLVSHPNPAGADGSRLSGYMAYLPYEKDGTDPGTHTHYANGTKPLTNWQADIAPDGLLRHRDDTRNNVTIDGGSSTGSVTAGAVDFWFKPSTKIGGSGGGNECLVYAVHPLSKTSYAEKRNQANYSDVEDIGMALKLTRFGKSIYATRFFGSYAKSGNNPKTPESPKRGSVIEGGFSISTRADNADWEPGTWHHVYIGWAANNQTLTLRADNKTADSTTAPISAVVGSSVAGFYRPGFAGDVNGETFSTYLLSKGRIVSIKPGSSNSRRYWVGGYNMALQSTKIYDYGINLSSHQNRKVMGTIDEFSYGHTKYSSSSITYERFTTSNPAWIQTRLQLPPGVELGTVSWTANFAKDTNQKRIRTFVGWSTGTTQPSGNPLTLGGGAYVRSTSFAATGPVDEFSMRSGAGVPMLAGSGDVNASAKNAIKGTVAAKNLVLAGATASNGGKLYLSLGFEVKPDIVGIRKTPAALLDFTVSYLSPVEIVDRLPVLMD